MNLTFLPCDFLDAKSSYSKLGIFFSSNTFKTVCPTKPVAPIIAYFCILILMNCNAISFDLQYKDKMILCKKQTEILYFVAIINLLNRL